MNQTGRTVSWTVWIGVLLTAALLTLALLAARLNQRRHQPAAPLPIISQVEPFTLTNQLGQPVTFDDFKGRVWVGDIIFTRCAGPCPVMTRKMRELQDALPSSSSARLVTLTTDPEADTPAALRSYADKFGAKTARWEFLTGDKVTIGRVAIDNLKLTAIAKKPEERNDAADLFVHSTIFVVVDKHGRLRATFQTEGELVSWEESKRQIIAAIQQLEREP
jgi:cytochrome oxidase Cu insertion factor (SCO1/SenC/PrrC family)